MMKLVCSLVSFLSFCLAVLSVSATQDEDKQVYVVYMGAIPNDGDYMLTSQHMNMLQEVTGESSTEDRLVRSYTKSFNGFAARLSESERELVAGMKGVVSVFPNRKLRLRTTISWDFTGMKEKDTKRVPDKESDIIVGVLDSGIWPESDSFDGKAFGPPPQKWKGVCAGGQNFTCNNKLIGARYYTGGDEPNGNTARDYSGHGTHTASTAAGNSVQNTSFYGLGLGTSRGGVPGARIAAYKACGYDECSTEALLAAFDDAIADGVDVISISIGADSALQFEEDPIVVGAFHAMAKGILTVNSAGNSGPTPGSVSSVAPWMLSVAASTTNRAFLTKVILGDGKTVVGRSVNAFDLQGRQYPLAYGVAETKACQEFSGGNYSQGCLDSVKGKIVLCNTQDCVNVAELGGAVGMIARTSDTDVSYVRAYPSSYMSAQEYAVVMSYANSTKEPTGSILRSEESMSQTAPAVVKFSSRGPNSVVAEILKPDLTAPGAEIVAAFSPEGSPSEDKMDKRRVKYNVMSGTSMSCPHVAGAAAYLKTFHPQWSPSMIHSALMTTAWPMNASANADAEFAYGSGHLDPIAAVNPGLVYEATKADHTAFLCGLNYTEASITLISGENITCTTEQVKALPRNLNYPSMSSKVSATNAFNVEFIRTVTNVGNPNSTYKAKVVRGTGSSELNVKVVPDVLSLKSMNEKMSFTVTVSGEGLKTNELVSASLVWSDGVHTVRSPIVVYV